MKAMTKPAAAIDQPNAEDPASSVAATDFVRYGAKTKVMITALKDADPQSHRAQLKMRRRLPEPVPEPGGVSVEAMRPLY